MRKRFLNLVVALGLVTGLLVGAVGSVGAAGNNGTGGPINGNPVPFDMTGSALYFAFVPNGAVINGVGPFFGTVTVQNVEDVPINITLSNTSGVAQQTAPLNPHASKTFSAASLNIPSTGNMVGGIKVTSTWQSTTNPAYLPLGVICGTTSPSTSSGQINVTSNATNGVDAFAAPAGQTINAISSIDFGTTVWSGPFPAVGASTATTPGVSINPNGQGATIDWTNVVGAPPENAIYQVNYKYTASATSQNCTREPYIAGVEKHMAAGNTALINANNGTAQSDGATVVDGYTGVSGADLPASTGITGLTGGPLNTIILPIVQNGWPTSGSGGWDSTIYISNLSGVANVGATITLYGAATQGVAGPSVIVPRHLMAAGETWALDLATVVGLPANWVGSAWISVDEPTIVAAASRNKVATMMSLTNTAAPYSLTDCSRLLDVPNQYPSSSSQLDCESSPIGPSVKSLTNYFRFDPLAFQNYNNWNTGFNIANLSDITNTVTITFYNYLTNSVSGFQENIPPRAMEYVYYPGNGTDAGLASVSAVVFSGTSPFHVATDEVKYMGIANTNSNQSGVGEAMSYMAVAHGAKGLIGPPDLGGANGAAPGIPFPINKLDVPLFQKGDPTSGLGDTSGVNMFNFGLAAVVDVIFYDQSGAPTAPTAAVDPAHPFIANPIEIDLGSLASATLYSLDPGNAEMPVGFIGSVDMQVINVGSEVAAVSNNVNYSIAGDGAAVYNAAAVQGNFLFPQGIIPPGPVQP